MDWAAIVMQPTTLCNLNCSYCYLPDRASESKMSVEVATAVSHALAQNHHVTKILWHGGEPLATGLDHLKTLLNTFEEHRKNGKCNHSIQTNATLINEDWCMLFREFGLSIGVSIDGGLEDSAARVNWNGRQAFDLVRRGIECLNKHGIKFGIIAVANKHNILQPERMYDALCEFGPQSISINIEEAEGLNQHATPHSLGTVKHFWEGLYESWRRNPRVPIRQFHDAVYIMNRLIDDVPPITKTRRFMYPTVSTKGDVVVLSPEFISVPLPTRKQFIVGNVLDKPLAMIIENAGGTEYVIDFFRGVEMCMQECAYFRFCGGGQASNKYFENGDLASTKTRYCNDSRIQPVEALMSAFAKRSI